jgi:NADPH:quinone reductase-like Zn-dependent oxidoreductase
MVKAVIFNELGGADVLRVIKDYNLPPKQDGEVTIKVHSTSVNVVDTKIRTKKWAPVYQTQLPRVPGGDVAGVVTEDGKKLKKGDRIVALTDRYAGPKKDGSYAELAYTNEDWAAPAPKTLSLETEAGAFPLVSLTAYQALESAKPKKGARVLILNASGGVGSMAVQLAKVLYDAEVVGTTGPDNVAFVKSLGVFEAVNYKNQDIAEVFKDPSKHFDAIVDLVGGDEEGKATKLLKPGGTLAHILNSGTDQTRIEEAKKWTNKKYTTTLVQPNGKQLSHIVELIDSGKIKVFIHQLWSLDEAKAAQEAVEAGHSRGKHVLQVCKK